MPMTKPEPMQRFYEPRHFGIKELVPQGTYSRMRERCLTKDEAIKRLLGLFDSRLLYTLDCLREHFGVRMHINNWQWGGDRNYSGFRPADCKIGAKHSQHRYGRAADIIIPNGEYDAEHMRLKIFENNILFPYITYMEDGVDWLHVDCRNADVKHIHLFRA